MTDPGIVADLELDLRVQMLGLDLKTLQIRRFWRIWNWIWNGKFGLDLCVRSTNLDMYPCLAENEGTTHPQQSVSQSDPFVTFVFLPSYLGGRPEHDVM